MIHSETLFESTDGTLSRRGPNGKQWRVIRERYSYTYRYIDTTHQLRATLRAGPFAWPGGYALYLLTDDGQPLCFACARQEYRQISESIRTKTHDGWRVVGCEMVDRGEDTGACYHCNRDIDPATRNPPHGARPDPDPDCDHCDGEGTEIHIGAQGYYDGHCTHCWQPKEWQS